MKLHLDAGDEGALHLHGLISIMWKKALFDLLRIEGWATLVNAKRSYHRSVGKILDNLHAQMIWQKQASESNLEYTASSTAEQNSTECIDTKHSNKPNDLQTAGLNCVKQFLYDLFLTIEQFDAVLHSFDAQAEGELSLSVGDYVVVRQVAPNGWSEGECNGTAGWFPFAYIERKEQILASNSVTSHLVASVQSPGNSV
ncbi:SH3 domain-containing protein 2-like [Aristolochia californica]|uniref:SH3 domain-containing protein 2-like n=1 Tax=Aristolochia californica TaxID=171875 RepID=UPI0035DFA712